MTHATAIEWTHLPGRKGETWNPIVGCSVISPGCTNCYAMQVAGLWIAISVAFHIHWLVGAGVTAAIALTACSMIRPDLP